jgi:putative ABC transport system permease protein
MLQDLTYALRRLRHRPGYAAAAILALALGIGCTTAIFSVMQAVLLRTLPVPDPERVVSLSEEQPHMPPDIPGVSMSGPDFHDLKSEARSFESMSSFAGILFRLTRLDQPDRVIGAETDADFFRVLQASPLVGRLYGPGSSGEVVLSERLWRRAFGADPRVVGRTVALDGDPKTVIGVLPSGASVPARYELWVSAVGELPVLPGFRQGVTMRGEHYLNGIARLRRGVTVRQAQAELDAISSRLAREYPQTNKDHRFLVGSLQERIVGDAKRPLFLLLGGVVFVLLIACANVAGLQLARAAAGERDLAIRLALGASRARIARQLLVESVTLAFAGGALGVVASWWGVKVLVTLAGRALPRASEVTVDPAVLAFALALSVLTGIVAGLLPALVASRTDSIGTLRGAASTTAARSKLRDVLVTAEIALALMLLAGAGLLIRSFERIRAVDPGFRPEGAVIVPLSHEEKGAAQFHAEVMRRVATLPGVRAAGAALSLPMGDSYRSGDITFEGRQPMPDATVTDWQVVSGDYFLAMGIPLVRGRYVTAQDTAGRARVAVVNEAFARHFFPRQEAVGKRFCYGVPEPGSSPDWIEIVGVVGNARQVSLAQAAAPEVYYPLGQSPTPAVEMTLVVRGDVGVGALIAALRREIAAIDPEQPLTGIQTLEEHLSKTLNQRRLSMLLLSIFSAAALLLAVLGIYATLAYSVAQRTREIGVRMALGARAERVVAQVIGHGMRVAGVGVLLGAAGSLLLGRLIAGLLFGVGAHDPATLASVVALLLAVALVACWIPARRAAHVDPVIALRAE